MDAKSDIEVAIAALFDYEIKPEIPTQLSEELLEPFTKRFSIAYIVCDSDTGKTTILKQLIDIPFGEVSETLPMTMANVQS
jgi:hypothetical protein